MKRKTIQDIEFIRVEVICDLGKSTVKCLWGYQIEMGSRGKEGEKVKMRHKDNSSEKFRIKGGRDMEW